MNFYEINLYTIFAIFLRMAIPKIYGDMVKIRKFILVIIYVIFPQKSQFRLENESLEISRNSV